MNSTFDPLVGQVLDDRYEIVAKVARGGMATVYRARDRRLSRVVAVKVMRSDLGEDDEFAAKFDREARSAAVLSHPNVVSIFDQGSSQGQPYIVMEYIEGETLRRLIGREAPLPPERALELFEQIAAALAAAHEAGVVHRDIKPENVMLTDRNQLKVADFGLARQVDSPQMTATGVLVGTASYLPPELVTHARPDGRSDIYSAGVVLFEMLTGCKPHTGENNYQIAYRHVNVDIEKPSEKLAQIGQSFDWPIPDYVDALVLACTRRDPRARIANGQDLLTEVRRVRHALTASGGSDIPGLAASLLPQSPMEVTTQRLHPRQRPRPATAGSSAPTVVVAESQWHAAEPSIVSPVPAPVLVEESPESAQSPRSQRTPVFPPLHISHDPVHRRRRGVIALLLVLLLTAGAGVGSWWWLSGRYTTVPAAANLNEAKAREAATANDLEISTSEEYSETVAKGLVIRTDPATGERVLRGATLAVVLSLGPERYPSPTLVGLTKDEAEKAIVAARMSVGEVTEAFSEDRPVGEVLSASQEAGTQLKPNTAIDLSVSKGKEPIKIPDLVGSSATDAEKQLKDLGFQVAVKEDNSATVAAGLVISQDPKGGDGVRGDTINLVKSLGPVMVTIPNVWGKNSDDAKKELEELDLKVEIQNDSGFGLPLNLVRAVEPGVGSSVPVGSTVKLIIV